MGSGTPLNDDRNNSFSSPEGLHTRDKEIGQISKKKQLTQQTTYVPILVKSGAVSTWRNLGLKMANRPRFY